MMIRNVMKRVSAKPMTAAPRRCLNLHEYQSKEIMSGYGIHVQKFTVAGTDATPASLLEAAKGLGLAADAEFVVKAQVHAGGRGKGHFLQNDFKGGVHVVRGAEKAAEVAQKMLGNNLVTKQTTAEGVPVSKVMIAEALDIDKEMYLAILMDRAYDGPVLVASAEGGVEIEEVAERNPDAIVKVPVSIEGEVTPEVGRDLAAKLGFKPQLHDEVADQIARLYKMFKETDSTQVEINPLVETPDTRVVAFDAKLSFDDNAAFRQQKLFALRDPTEEDPREVEASKHDLNYIGMDGSIGCMVNGAGLAMATCDIISKYGGSPANFLDVGGGANETQVASALSILQSDPKVKAILVNIFGGIMKCDVIAAGVVAGAKQVQLKVPLVVRLEGTNVEAGQTILKESGLPIITANDLDDAAQKAVAAAE